MPDLAFFLLPLSALSVKSAVKDFWGIVLVDLASPQLRDHFGHRFFQGPLGSETELFFDLGGAIPGVADQFFQGIGIADKPDYQIIGSSDHPPIRSSGLVLPVPLGPSPLDHAEPNDDGLRSTG